MLSFINAEYHIQANCAECHLAECHSAEFHYTECHGAILYMNSDNKEAIKSVDNLKKELKGFFIVTCG
jgi:hypothetical protein